MMALLYQSIKELLNIPMKIPRNVLFQKITDEDIEVYVKMRGMCTDPNVDQTAQENAKEITLKVHNNLKKAVEGEVGPIVSL